MSRCSDCNCSKAEECGDKTSEVAEITDENVYEEAIEKYKVEITEKQPTIGDAPSNAIPIAYIDAVRLEANDVLIVTLKDDSITESDLDRFNNHMKALFPNNQVMVINLSENSDVRFTKISKE